jgi:hypothetical protein
MTADHFADEGPRAAGAQDLSDEISRAVEKRPGDDVRCTRVSDGNYRCNWWSPHPTSAYDNPLMSGLLVTTHRVRESRFLHVTKEAGKLVIKELPSATAR